MNERTRPPAERQTADPGGSSDVLGAPLSDHLVALTAGPYGGQLPLAGRSVAEVRRRYGDRYEIAPQMQAFVDSAPVSDDTVLLAGQVLTFMHLAGEKGADGMRLVIEGDTITLDTPEGQQLPMPLADWLAALDRPRFDAGSCPLPAGVVAFWPLRDAVILVHQCEPSVRRLRWLADDSPAPFGEAAVYREVSLAMPYVLVLATFRRGPDGLYRLTGDSEAFFRTAPLRSLDDPLLFPALLNCSRMTPDPRRPLAWICVQYLDVGEVRAGDDDAARLRSGLAALLRHLWETGFNRSSEVHEAGSWYTATREAAIDPRVASVDAWERASADDPNFVLDVPWLDAGHTLEQQLQRMARRMDLADERPRSVIDLARPVLATARGESPRERLRRRLAETQPGLFPGDAEVPF